MNILHVVNVYFVLPYFIGDQFSYFRDKGYKLFVACSKSEYIADFAKRNRFDYIETPIKRSISILDDLKSIYAICKYIREKKIDIIVGHTPKGGLIAMISGWLCAVPQRIYFRHGLVYETSHGLLRFILKNVDRMASLCSTKIICVSQSVLDRSIEDKLAPAKKQAILGKGTCNGVDTENLFNPQKVNKDRINELRLKYGIEPHDFVIGYSGRLVRDKGIIELVSAFEKLDYSDNCKLLLVGMFEERDSLPDNVQQHIRQSKQ